MWKFDFAVKSDKKVEDIDELVDRLQRKCGVGINLLFFFTGCVGANMGGAVHLMAMGYWQSVAPNLFVIIAMTAAAYFKIKEVMRDSEEIGRLKGIQSFMRQAAEKTLGITAYEERPN